MNYMRITKENIDKEHICCAMSGKQSIAKKEWMKQRFEEDLVFYRSEREWQMLYRIYIGRKREFLADPRDIIDKAGADMKVFKHFNYCLAARKN